MIITRKGDYGLRAILYLAQQPPGKLSSIKEISRAMEVPMVFLSKVMKLFVEKGYVISKRGISGGYMLAKPPYAITLREVIEAIEGPLSINKCLLKRNPCGRKPKCVASPVWEKIQKNLLNEMDHYTIGMILKE